MTKSQLPSINPVPGHAVGYNKDGFVFPFEEADTDGTATPIHQDRRYGTYSSSRRDQAVGHFEYRGKTVLVVEVTHYWPVGTTGYGREPVTTFEAVDLSGARWAKGKTAESLVPKAVKLLDELAENDALRPQAILDIHREVTNVPAENVAVGDLVGTHAQNKVRPVRVVKVGPKRATVAWTTPSSHGRIYRKSVPLAELKEVES